MALAAVIAGPYSGAWGSFPMGQQKDGFRLQIAFGAQDVMSNTYGDSIIDGVYRGGNTFLTYTGIEAALATAMLAPLNSISFGKMGLPGILFVGGSETLASVLTAVAGTSTSSSPASLTAENSILATGFNAELNYATAMREVPITMRCYPYDTGGGSIGWFVTT